MQRIHDIGISQQVASHGSYVFISAAILGIYLSIIILVSAKLRGTRGVQLGLFTALISILLLSIMVSAENFRIINQIVQLLGVVALFAVGPVSFSLFTVKDNLNNTYLIFASVLPALISGILSIVLNSTLIWLFVAGIIYTGFWLLLQSIGLFRSNLPADWYRLLIPVGIKTWNIRYTLLQLLTYLVICISFATDHSSSIISGVVAILILLIWIRMLRSAYITYTMRFQ